jgi:amino acid transporter
VTTPDQPAAPASVTLRRALGLRALVIYGLVLIQPTAPMPLYGVVSQAADGHVVTTILIGMVAMLFTAISYGRMANVYPTAGSAYTYVGRELHPALGYLTGWSMMFDYVMNPIICVVWCSNATVELGILPVLPRQFWVVVYALLFTGLNLRGIQASDRTNTFLAVALTAVIVWFFAAVARFLCLHPPADAAAWTRPFYNPATFSWRHVSNGAALAVLTYIGFDSISTLSEEAHNPRRNVLLATVLVCLITGVLAAAEVYAAQLAWSGPVTALGKPENAFAHVAGQVGGDPLFRTLTVALLVANIGSGVGAHLGAGRLLYGMGRDDAIPRGFFGRLHPRTRVPANNILLVGGVALVGAFLVNYALGAELLNFGALIGFMGVNICALVHYFVRGRDRRWHLLVSPVLGFLVCLFLWTSLSWKARAIGFAWLTLGVLYGAWRTGGYRRPLKMFIGETS